MLILSSPHLRFGSWWDYYQLRSRAPSKINNSRFFCGIYGLKGISSFSTYESRAETHERFYMIEVHRHRFEMFARKVPFEKCTRWRKVCGRSAKDQIGDSIYSIFFTISSERFAKGARKMRERRIHSNHACPDQNGLHLAMPDFGPREKKQHITMTFWLLPFIRANNHRFIV